MVRDRSGAVVRIRYGGQAKGPDVVREAPGRGSMDIFATSDAAEQLARNDPFVLNGVQRKGAKRLQLHRELRRSQQSDGAVLARSAVARTPY